MHIVYFWICFVIVLFVKQIVTEECRTPEMHEGQCTPLFDCPKVLKVFAKPPKGSETYLRKYVCRNGGAGIEVCCDNSSSILMLAEQYLIFDSPQALLKDILPDDCEEQHSYESVIPDIVATHSESGVEYVKCFGTLINSRYVITSAECIVQNDKSQESAIVGVRFTSSKNSYFFGVEEEIPHPFYDPATKINDLALLRLDETVLEDGVKLYLCTEIDNDDRLTRYNGLNVNASIGEQRRYRIFTSSEVLSTSACREMLKNKHVNAVVTEYDICMEDFRNSTEITCNEYAGSPLIHVNIYNKKRLIGISSSKIGCADGLPNVYTNLLTYRVWLRDNMRPWSNDNEQCRTPSGDAGQSLPIYYCPALLEIFSDARSGTIDYLDKLVVKQERWGYTFFVCCPKSPNSAIFANKTVLSNIDVPPQFLDERCGLQHRDDYFSSSTAIAIDEFPWIASIISKPYIRTIERGGVLINARYVLTKAISIPQAEIPDLIVRLGDFRTQKEEDCVKDADIDGTDCTVTEYFGVEDVIGHPFFTWELHRNNVGLIRLNRTVLYSDFIRPICLPVQGTVTAKPGDTMHKSGWFYDKDEGMKVKILTRLLSYKECQRMLRISSEEYIPEGTICTVDYETTRNDYILGGALMFSNNYKWHIEGIVDNSYVGYIDDPPLRYANVSKYLNWILENMRPWK